tara:strand:- start:2208 stop:2741 length:534 start_codon:yes stop_codon:yes gene_type:complete
MKLSILDTLFHYIFLRKIKIEKLGKEQKEMTILNIKKHVKILFLMIIAMAYCYYIIPKEYPNEISIVLSSLLGVLFVSGTAWYAITFGAIPTRFSDFAVQITAYLFCAFAVSLAAVFSAATIAIPLLSPVLVVAFYALYAASVQYDIVDALKIGIDEAVLEHAKIGRVYFVRELKKK